MLPCKMHPEKEYTFSSEEVIRRQDLAWIEESRTLLWLAATVAGEQVGRGVLVVDLSHQSTNTGSTFGYCTEGELEIVDERLHEFLQMYNLQREFIVTLRKPAGQVHTYLDHAPAPGWWEELHAHAPCLPTDPDHTSP